MTYLSEFMPRIWHNKTLVLARRPRVANQHTSILMTDQNMSVMSSVHNFERSEFFLEESKQNEVQKQNLQRWNFDVLLNHDIP